MGDLEGASPQEDLKIAKPRTETHEVLSSETLPKPRIQRYKDVFIKISGLETRGIEPVPADERHPSAPGNYTRVFLLWLSSSLTPNNIIVGLYGPSYYGLDLTEAAVCAVMGVILGSMAVGYMGTWGPKSGNRTLVVTRFFVGYYPSKIFYILNILTMLGYAMVNDILGGQIIYTISGDHTNITIGIVIVAILTWAIATFGMHVFHLYSRYAWIVQLSILSIMLGCTAPNFNTSSTLPTAPSAPSSSRLSFFSLSLASAITWSPSSADYFVYLPSSTSAPRMFVAATSGMALAMTLSSLLGIGLATGLPTTETWQAASQLSQGTLLATSFAPLHTLGTICAVALLLSTVSNNIPCTYSAGLNLQMALGRYGGRVPRPILTTVEVIVSTVCAILARHYLREIIENFLPLMSYWIVIWLGICIEEVLVFRWRRRRADGGKRGEYDWGVWDMASRLPVGLAAGVTIGIGIMGAVLGMSQSYYTGPIAKTMSQPADLGMWLAFGFTVVVYPPLRAVELWAFGR